MRFKAVISGIALAVAPLPASAVSIADCEGHPLLSHHVIETEHQVVGEGIVVFYRGGGICTDDLGCTNSEFVLYSACETGQTLRIASKLEKDFDGTKLNRTAEANEIVQELAAEGKNHSWVSVKETFERKAFQVDEYMDSKENCACAAAFPELRNGKEKFEVL